MMEALYAFSRFVATLVGIALVIKGGLFAAELFETVKLGLLQPSHAMEVFDQWAELLVRDLGKLEHNPTLQHAESLRIIAAFMVGAGTFLLAWLSIQIILAGAKVIAWTAGEYAGMRRLLSHALGGKLPQGAEPSQSEEESAFIAPPPQRRKGGGEYRGSKAIGR